MYKYDQKPATRIAGSPAKMVQVILGLALFLTAGQHVNVTHATPKTSDSGRWVSYSAHYTETVSTRDASGVATDKQTFTEEVRSEDGAFLSVVKENGQAISGKLSQADGHGFSLDYLKKRAIDDGVSPRRHPFVPPDPILGTKVILGVTCDIYPLHMHLGNVTDNGKTNGTICVDMNADIIGSVEIHSYIAGIRQDYTKQLTWIDLNSPVDPSTIKVPDGFTTLVPSTGQH
ncbi:MAG: hypothetical protein WB795_03960 [Candidatus Acidiferrales bacterium]